MNVIVEVMGLELQGRHGVLDEERRDGQRFLFDLRLETAEPQDDRIEDAVDYREVVALVREISDGRSFQLLESFAAAVADALLARLPLVSVRVRVRKPDVTLDAPVEFTSACVSRP